MSCFVESLASRFQAFWIACSESWTIQLLRSISLIHGHLEVSENWLCRIFGRRGKMIRWNWWNWCFTLWFGSPKVRCPKVISPRPACLLYPVDFVVPASAEQQTAIGERSSSACREAAVAAVGTTIEKQQMWGTVILHWWQREKTWNNHLKWLRDHNVGKQCVNKQQVEMASELSWLGNHNS